MPPTSNLPLSIRLMWETLPRVPLGAAAGLNPVSSAPSALSRAIPLRVTPPTLVKFAPIRTLPSGEATIVLR